MILRQPDLNFHLNLKTKPIVFRLYLLSWALTFSKQHCPINIFLVQDIYHSF